MSSRSKLHLPTNTTARPSRSLAGHAGRAQFRAINLCSCWLLPGAWWNQQGVKGKFLLQRLVGSRKHNAVALEASQSDSLLVVLWGRLCEWIESEKHKRAEV